MKNEPLTKKQKLILAGCLASIGLVIGLILVIGLSFWLFNKSDAKAIERVLAADSQTNPGAVSVAEIVRRMEAIDLAGCPRDFKQAYIAHIGAWRQMAMVEQEAQVWGQRYNSGGAMLEAFLRDIR